MQNSNVNLKTTKNIVFIDSQVKDYQSLAEGVIADIEITSGTFLLDSPYCFPRFPWLFISWKCSTKA